MNGKWGVRSVLTLVVIALAIGMGVSLWWRGRAEDRREAVSTCPSNHLSRPADQPTGRPETSVSHDAEVSVEDEADAGEPDSGASEEPPTEEEKREAEEEAKVEAFDGMTDKWMEPAAKGVSMADVNAFVRAFRDVPKERQDECVHRALNLIPDENVMLLAGILMDRSLGEEVAETVFADILNRNEDVKMVILQQVYKDKTHPCWTDAAWILDVTGEQPK